MKKLNAYRIQVTGPSGCGKTYFSQQLKKLGYNSIDADSIENLGKFINKEGEEVEYYHQGDVDWLRNNLWMWDTKTLKEYLTGQERVIIFGGASNELDASHFFDYVFYLDLPVENILLNLTNAKRINPYGKTKAQQIYAKERIKSFYNNLGSNWLPLKARDPLKLIDEIEALINAKLSNDE